MRIVFSWISIVLLLSVVPLFSCGSKGKSVTLGGDSSATTDAAGDTLGADTSSGTDTETGDGTISDSTSAPDGDATSSDTNASEDTVTTGAKAPVGQLTAGAQLCTNPNGEFAIYGSLSYHGVGPHRSTSNNFSLTGSIVR